MGMFRKSFTVAAVILLALANAGESSIRRRLPEKGKKASHGQRPSPAQNRRRARGSLLPGSKAELWCPHCKPNRAKAKSMFPKGTLQCPACHTPLVAWLNKADRRESTAPKPASILLMDCIPLQKIKGKKHKKNKSKSKDKRAKLTEEFFATKPSPREVQCVEKSAPAQVVLSPGDYVYIYTKSKFGNSIAGNGFLEEQYPNGEWLVVMGSGPPVVAKPNEVKLKSKGTPPNTRSSSRASSPLTVRD